jgi:hypothetical protein
MPEAAERHRLGTMFDGQIGMCMETALFYVERDVVDGKITMLV